MARTMSFVEIREEGQKHTPFKIKIKDRSRNRESNWYCQKDGRSRGYPIWQIHQRAYKKYFARTKKGAMTKAEFEVWAREAEELRNQALKEYERAGAEEREKIETQVREALNMR